MTRKHALLISLLTVAACLVAICAVAVCNLPFILSSKIADQKYRRPMAKTRGILKVYRCVYEEQFLSGQREAGLQDVHSAVLDSLVDPDWVDRNSWVLLHIQPDCALEIANRGAVDGFGKQLRMSKERGFTRIASCGRDGKFGSLDDIVEIITEKRGR